VVCEIQTITVCVPKSCLNKHVYCALAINVITYVYTKDWHDQQTVQFQ
jgi:hypothetical protein